MYVPFQKEIVLQLFAGSERHIRALFNSINDTIKPGVVKQYQNRFTCFSSGFFGDDERKLFSFAWMDSMAKVGKLTELAACGFRHLDE